MKRFLLIAMAAVVATIAAILTTPRSPRPQPDQDLNGKIVEEGEAGISVVDTPEVRVAKGKEKSKQMTDSIIGISDEEWLRSWELTERSGKKVHSDELKGQPYIASFFFSTCPVVCVKQNDQLSLLQDKFQKLPIRLVSITCDPENDTPEQLAAYAQRFGAKDNWLFLTGDWNYLKRVSSEVFFHGLHRPKEHIERFLLMDETGKLIAEYDWHSKEEIKLLEEDVKRLLKEKKAP